MIVDEITRFHQALTHGTSLMSAALARGYALAGRRDEAQQGLRELQLRGMYHYVSPFGLAHVYAALGDKNAALDMVPRFQELLQRVGFPQ